MIEISLPVPPSLNNCYVNASGRGRFKSTEYRIWCREAQAYLMAAPKGKVAIGYSLHIVLPVNMRGDLDNRVKPLSDVLVASGVLPDDKHAAKITVERGAARDGLARLTITGGAA